MFVLCINFDSITFTFWRFVVRFTSHLLHVPYELPMTRLSIFLPQPIQYSLQPRLLIGPCSSILPLYILRKLSRNWDIIIALNAYKFWSNRLWICGLKSMFDCLIDKRSRYEICGNSSRCCNLMWYLVTYLRSSWEIRIHLRLIFFRLSQRNSGLLPLICITLISILTRNSTTKDGASFTLSTTLPFAEEG